jgi:hypothetical protein
VLATPLAKVVTVIPGISRALQEGKMKTRQVVSTVVAILMAFSLGYSAQRAARVVGTPSNLGNGTVASYAEFDKSGALDALPAAV